MPEIKKYISEFKNGTKTMFKEFFNKETNKKQRANMWTFSRLLISFIVPILMIISGIISSPILLGFAVGTTAFGALTDFFDGRSARKHKSYSEYGKLLDQIVDKIFSIMLGISLCILNPFFMINLIGEGIIAGINISHKKKYKDISLSSTKMGKIKEWPLFSSFALGFLSALLPTLTNITNILIMVTFLFQLGTMYSYIQQEQELDKMVKSSEIQKYLRQIKEDAKDYEKTTILEKENNNANKVTSSSRKEQYIKLRNALVALKNNSTNKIDNIEENKQEIQKIKK